MNKKQRFEVMFDPEASREYEKLDNSIIKIVNKAIYELETRADEIGKPLGNTNIAKLAGCKEIKLRDIGVRIVFKVTNEFVQVLRIVYILAITQRADGYVFKAAQKRLKSYKNSKERKHNIKDNKKK